MALTKVGKGGLDKGSIKDQTALGGSAADTDRYLVYDASADALKYIAASNVTPNETLITGKDALSLADLTTADQLLIYDASAGVLKKITKGNLVASQPTISSVSPTNALTGDGTGNYTFVISGTSYENVSAVKFIGNDGTEYTASSTTENSATQLTAVVAKSTLPIANEPYDIKVTNNNGLTVTNADAFNIDAQPVYSTAAGSLGTITNANRSGVSFTVVAADPESGGDVVYTLESGSLPAGLSLSSTSSGGVISGNATAVGSNTTSSFTIRAKDAASNVTDRAFSITINAPVVSSFTSSGTYSVPSGVSTVDVLVVAGGGSGGLQHGGAGGAGGLIYRPAFPVSPGGTVSVTVGNGGPSGSGGAPNVGNGSDSAFGTLTAKGGGRGSVGNNSTGGPQDSTAGGSGGGGGYQANASGASGTQPSQGGDSGNYGFGNNGGNGGAPTPGEAGGGGGGAGAVGAHAGVDAAGHGGHGGVGKAYTISGTSVYYAGGGGGGAHSGTSGYFGDGGQGGGGDGSLYAPGNANAQNGTANRGGGGGGAGAAISQHATVNAGGGKGVVIVSY